MTDSTDKPVLTIEWRRFPGIGDVQGRLLNPAGQVHWEHVSSNKDWLANDLLHNFERERILSQAYPTGFEVVWKDLTPVDLPDLRPLPVPDVTDVPPIKLSGRVRLVSDDGRYFGETIITDGKFADPISIPNDYSGDVWISGQISAKLPKEWRHER